MSLLKKIIVFSISLLSALSFIPQINIAFADTSTPTCSSLNPPVSISVQYQLSLEQWSDWAALNANTAIPEGVKDIHFLVSGGNSIPSKNINGQDILYRINFPALNTSTDNQQADGGVTGTLSTYYTGSPNPNPLISRGIRYGTLQSNASGNYVDFCKGINYSIGAATVYDFSTCRMTLSQFPPSSNQSVTASVQYAPPTEPGNSYSIMYTRNEEYIDKTNPDRQSDKKVSVDQDGNGHFVFFTNGDPHTKVGLYLYDTVSGTPFCRLNPEQFDIGTTPVTPPNNCSIDPANPTIAQNVFVVATNVEANKEYRADITTLRAPNAPNVNTNILTLKVADNRGIVRLALNDTIQKLQQGHYSAQVYKNEDNSLACTKDFWVGSVGVPLAPVRPCSDPNSSTCGSSGGVTLPDCPGIITGIGCIETTPSGFIKNILTFVIGISGGLAFLMMLLGAFQMLTSAGNPETLNAGRERLTSAVIGLLFVIFAMLLLQIIGFGILKIPGFGT